MVFGNFGGVVRAEIVMANVQKLFSVLERPNEGFALVQVIEVCTHIFDAGFWPEMLHAFIEKSAMLCHLVGMVDLWFARRSGVDDVLGDGSQ